MKLNPVFIEILEFSVCYILVIMNNLHVVVTENQW